MSSGVKLTRDNGCHQIARKSKGNTGLKIFQDAPCEYLLITFTWPVGAAIRLSSTMKAPTFKPLQDKKPASPILQPKKAPDKHPDGLPIHPLLAAWLCLPVQPKLENYLHLLRNRSN
jgi:hypothetical protein